MTDKIRFQFVDTNVLIYAHDISAGEKRERARALLEKLWDSGTGCISIQVLQEFYVRATRRASPVLNLEEAVQVVSDMSTWRVHNPNVEDALDAIRLSRRYEISFWDAMVIESASQMGCEMIWSEDLSSGQIYDGMRVENPFAA